MQVEHAFIGVCLLKCELYSHKNSIPHATRVWYNRGKEVQLCAYVGIVSQVMTFWDVTSAAVSSLDRVRVSCGGGFRRKGIWRSSF